MPHTPACTQSPITEESFADVMAYDLGSTFNSQPMNSIQLQADSKSFASSENMFESWTMIAPNAPLPEEDHQLDETMNADLDMSWVNVPTNMCLNSSPCMLPSDMSNSDNFRLYWGLRAQYPDIAGPIMMHDPFMNTSSMEEVAASFPQTPQEVCFKREESFSEDVDVKYEEVDEGLTRSIHVSPTGGKTVKRERRKRRVPKKRSKSAGHDNSWETGIGIKFHLHEGVVRDEKGRLQKGYCAPTKKFACSFQGCTKKFKRPEHRRRHEDSHSGKNVYHCSLPTEICKKSFNRFDNCMAHHFTHIRKPGKEGGRNDKFTLEEVLSFVTNPKTAEKLRRSAPMQSQANEE